MTTCIQKFIHQWKDRICENDWIDRRSEGYKVYAPHSGRCSLYSKPWRFKECVCIYACVLSSSAVKRDFIKQHTMSRMHNVCMFFVRVLLHTLFDLCVCASTRESSVSAAAHGCASLMRRAGLHRGFHLMRTVELVKHTTGVHVISMSLALDMAQLQTHTHTETLADNTIYWYHTQHTH